MEKVTVEIVEFWCDKCDSNTKYVGKSGNGYIHICPKCEEEYHLDRIYPWYRSR